MRNIPPFRGREFFPSNVPFFPLSAVDRVERNFNSRLLQYNRTGQGSQCNQAIMLITAGPVLASYKDVLKHYNWPHMPVRMFTYLLGKDSTAASELHKIACGNKGDEMSRDR